MTHTGKLIKKLRLENELSQRALAAHLGFSNVFLGKVEMGKCNLPVKYIAKVSKKLGVSRSDVLNAMNKDITAALIKRSKG
jgi:transcriptional regulator with XRE-family HTH domain